MGKVRQLSHQERLAAQVLGKKHLYDDISNIYVYKNYRDNLRPWDRTLPPIVQQEADRRDLWVIKPPSGWAIIGMLFLCLLLWQIIALLPVVSNWEHIKLAWRDTEKPEIVYDNPKVLMSAWIGVHLCSGFALWFLWLSEGFDKHALELAPMLVFSIIEGLWCDILFYTRRIDWTIAAWFVIMFFIFLCQAACFYKKQTIAALFLFPHVAACLVVIIYGFMFLTIFPDKTWYAYDNPQSKVLKTN